MSSSVDLHRDDWVMALRRDDVSLPGRPGEPFQRLVLEHPGAVIVLAVDEQERVLVLRQYRHAARTRFVELPAGLRDVHGEPPEETARRELREEAMLEARCWEQLVEVFPSPGISSERYVVFLATGLSEAPDRAGFTPEHEEADMTVGWEQVDDLVAGVLDGRLRNGSLAVAVLAYRARSAGP